jgi:hypothetical protein
MVSISRWAGLRRPTDLLGPHSVPRWPIRATWCRPKTANDVHRNCLPVLESPLAPNEPNFPIRLRLTHFDRLAYAEAPGAKRTQLRFGNLEVRFDRLAHAIEASQILVEQVFAYCILCFSCWRDSTLLIVSEWPRSREMGLPSLLLSRRRAESSCDSDGISVARINSRVPSRPRANRRLHSDSVFNPNDVRVRRPHLPRAVPPAAIRIRFGAYT